MCNAALKSKSVTVPLLATITASYSSMVKELTGEKSGIVPMRTLGTECNAGHQHRLCIYMTGGGKINGFDMLFAQKRNGWSLAKLDPVSFSPFQYAALIGELQDEEGEESVLEKVVTEMAESIDFVIYGALYTRHGRKVVRA